MTTPNQAADFLPLSPADFQLLLILMDGGRHAYGIAQAVAEQDDSSVELGIGSLYRMLARLQGWGLLEEDPTEQASASGPPRKVYRITELGIQAVRAEAARLRDVLALADARLSGAEAR